MALARRAAAVAQLTRLMPKVDKIAAMPLAKRDAVKPPKFLVGKVPAGVTTTDLTVPTADGATVRVRLYHPPTPASAPLPAVVYAHGGGFITGGLLGAEHICQHIAGAAGVLVASVAYRLAPEHPFPGPLHDCRDVARWLHDQPDVDSSRLAVAGDSAGGNLAAALARLSRDGEAPTFLGQALIYPALDATLSTESARNYTGLGLPSIELRGCYRHHLNGADPNDPLASPFVAADLTALPPALVMTAGHDSLHDEGVAYAERLLAADVPTVYRDFPDYLHGFFSLPRVYPGIETAWDTLTDFLHEVLITGPASAS